MKKITSHPIIKNGHNIVLALASILLIAVLFYAAFFVSDTNKVKAGVTHNVSGWAWSADNDSNDDGVFDSLDKEIGGVGWISFNCTNTSSCATVDYGVNIDINGDMSGYAWYGWEDSDGSTVGGWISFNVSDLSGCPSGVCEAKLVGNNLQGWARALSYRDGWDGWISLNGATYGVTKNGNNLEGYAWDASDISGKQIGIGWIDFSPTNPTYGGVMIAPNSVPIVTLSANPVSVSPDGNSRLTWSSSNATACTGSIGWSGSKALSGFEDVGPHTIDTVYRITCTNSTSSRDDDATVFVDDGSGSFECSDSIDNTDPEDILIDANDPGCYDIPPGGYDANDDDETDTLPECSNFFDDDGDGNIDYPNDPGCSSADDDREQNIGFEEF